MIAHPRVTAAILAGGRATRMGGANKALLPLGHGADDTPLARLVAVLAGRFAGPMLVTSQEQSAGAREWAATGVLHVHDRAAGFGPIGGLHAALSQAATPIVFACGCDMPTLSGPLLDFMAPRARTDRPLVPVRLGRVEPLHAFYPVAILPEVERAMGDGVRMLRDLLERVGADYLEEADYLFIGGARESFRNINTPEDLGEARR